MNRAEEFAAAVRAQPHDALPKPVAALLDAIARAWQEAEAGFPSEDESWRWSPVCAAAEQVVGIGEASA